MSVFQRVTLFSVAGALAGAAAIVTPSVGTAAGLGAQPALTYDMTVLDGAAAASVVSPADDGASLAPAPKPQVAAVDPAALECMTKVVMHEAGHEPRAGKVAVAQTLVNRLKDGRFGDTICAVANQRGQFFHTAAYTPDRDSDTWNSARDVAAQVLRGEADVVVPGAMFFHSASSHANTFFRSRQHVATIGAQVFYR